LYAMEAEATGEGTNQMLETKTEAGILIATHAPAGYQFAVVGETGRGKAIRGKLVPNEYAPAVRAAFELKAAGGSWAELAGLLTEAGVPTSGGRALWSKMAARSLIENPVYMGTVRNGGREKLNAHEPLVPGWLWRKAQPGRRAPYSRGEGHLLGEGLVRCQRCGAGLARSRSGSGYLTLRCPTPGQGHAAISYPKAERYIVAAAIEQLGVTISALQLGEDAGDLEAAEAALASAREELAELEALRGSVSPASYAQAHSDALAALEAAEDALAALERRGAWWATPYLLTIAGGNRLAFEALPLPEQRRFLHEQIAGVTLKPGSGAVEERLAIEWKQEPGPGEITDQDWTVLQLTDWAGLAFQGVPAGTPITSEIIDALREQAVADLRRGGGLRRGAAAPRPAPVGDTAAPENG